MSTTGSLQASTPEALATLGATTGRAFKYQFDLQLKRVKLEIPFPCMVQLSWRRGNKSITTKNKVQLLGQEKEFMVSERLSMMSTCYLDDVTRKFTQKSSFLNVIIFINGTPKSGGCCSIDLSEVLNPLSPKTTGSNNYEIPLTKCPIKNSSISYSLTATYLQEMVSSADEQRSVGSAVAYSSFSDFNLSFQSRKLVYQAPSKDSASTHSVRKEDARGNSGFKRRGADTLSQFTTPSGDSSNNIFSKKVGDEYGTRGDSVSRAERMSLKDEKLRQEKFKTDTQNTQLKFMVNEQSKKLNEYLSQCSQLRLELKTLKAKLDSVVADKQNSDQQKTKIQQQLVFWKAEADKAKAEVGTLRADRNNLENHIEQQRNMESYRYQQQIKQLQNLISNQMKDIEGKIVEKDKFDEVKLQLAKSQDGAKKMQLENEKLKAKLESDATMNTLLNTKLTEKEAQIERLKRDSDRVFLEKQELVRNRAELLDEINNQSAKLNQYANQYRNLEKALLSNNKTLDETKRELDRARLQQETAKKQHQRNNQSRAECQRLREQVKQLNNQCSNLSNYSSQLQRNLEKLETQRQEEATNARDRDLALLKQKESLIHEKEVLIKDKNNLLKRVADTERDSEQLRQNVGNLTQQNKRLKQEALEISRDTEQLTIQLAQLIRENQQLGALKEQYESQTSSHDSQLMKDNVELELKLNVQEEELKRLRRECQEVQQLRNKISFEMQSAKEAQEQLLAVEKELKDRNRLLILETEKVRIYEQEREQFKTLAEQKNFLLELELEKNENLEKNIKNMEASLHQTEEKTKLFEAELRKLEALLERSQQKSKQINILEQRVAELERENSDRLNQLQKNREESVRQAQSIQDLQRLLEFKAKQLSNKEQALLQLENKLHTNQLQLASGREKTQQLQKRVAILMQEVCTWRQKDQSSCVNTAANTELEGKVHALESTLSRREEKIRRLEKQNSKLEEQNIQLNIRIMKELTEMQKKQEGIKKEYCKTLNKVLSESNI